MHKIIVFLVLFPIAGLSQDLSNWQHLDPESDSILGISTYKAYEYLQGRMADTVIVAIIDNGAALMHEDLQGIFWVNGNEISDNHIDDDGNGYVDDIHGWNFLGNPDGNNLKQETLELTRLYVRYDSLYKEADTNNFTVPQLQEYKEYQRIKTVYETETNDKRNEITLYRNMLSDYYASDSLIKKRLKKDVYTMEDLEKIRSRKKEISAAKDFMIRFHTFAADTEVLKRQIRNLNSDLDTKFNPLLKNREQIVKDNPHDLTDTLYGNNMIDVMGPSHGTGVIGAIAALHNETGVDGIACAVKVIILRAVPNGDERDKDVALAIKYAIRNGAQIINCSFGKKYAAHPEFLQEAIAEAERKGVLIVHAAGNDGENTDETMYYPSDLLIDSNRAGNWITVGASMPFDNEDLVASFSNYGNSTVDIFAPGYLVMTCTLDNDYGFFSGTSIAAPIVTGVAAVLKGYFPNLSANDIKEIIIRSSYVPGTSHVRKPGGNGSTMIDFSDLSVSGGIVNLYQAILLAEKEYGQVTGSGRQQKEN